MSGSVIVAGARTPIGRLLDGDKVIESAGGTDVTLKIRETLLGIPMGEHLPPYLPVDEESAVRPQSSYSLGKAVEEEMARHFAGMTGVDMDERFARHTWGQSAQGLPLLEDALASLQGRIVETQEVGTHSVFLVELDEIATREHCTGLVYFGRHFH